MAAQLWRLGVGVYFTIIWPGWVIDSDDEDYMKFVFECLQMSI